MIFMKERGVRRAHCSPPRVLVEGAYGRRRAAVCRYPVLLEVKVSALTVDVDAPNRTNRV